MVEVITPYRSGLSLVGLGLLLWIIGLLVIALVPVVGNVGAVLVVGGQVLFWIGVAVLVIQLLVALFKSLFG